LAGVSADRLLGPLSQAADIGGQESRTTVLIAFAANLLVAIAKSVAAAVTASASLVAEAAHSWADTGNQVFLLVAARRARRPPDRAHPLGHGREAYVWSLLAAIGLFVAGAAVSVSHGVQELRNPEPASNFVVGYAVLAFSFVLEGISFTRSIGQARPAAALFERDVISQVMATSDPTLRAVFAEDGAALIGLTIATAGLGAHQLTGSAVPDALGSILVGLLLAAVAVVLINRNRQFLVGEEADPRVRAAVIHALLREPEVARVTYLRLEIVGSADGVGHRRCRLGRRRLRVLPSRPPAGARSQDRRVTSSRRHAAEPFGARRAVARRVIGSRPEMWSV
jgi:cation diffusion facilitator family transporter